MILEIDLKIYIYKRICCIMIIEHILSENIGVLNLKLPALPCFNIFNRARDEIYTCSAVSTTGASVGAEFCPIPIPAPPNLNKRSLILIFIFSLSKNLFSLPSSHSIGSKYHARNKIHQFKYSQESIM